MNQYVTGSLIRKLREDAGMTQLQLAEKLHVSDKTVSKWETGKGYPDITLLESLAEALGISVAELFSGNEITNRNRAGNMRRMSFYVCPVCGNILTAMGSAVINCCGVSLLPVQEETPDPEHELRVETIEDEYYVTLEHPMTREHFMSFLAARSDDTLQLKKLYPEGPAEAYFKIRGTRELFAYCNRHGLFRVKIR